MKLKTVNQIAKSKSNILGTKIKIITGRSWRNSNL